MKELYVTKFNGSTAVVSRDDSLLLHGVVRRTPDSTLVATMAECHGSAYASACALAGVGESAFEMQVDPRDIQEDMEYAAWVKNNCDGQC